MMKKMLKTILAAVFAFGAVGVVGNTLSAKKVEATATTIEDWSGYKETDLQLSIDPSLADSDLDYNYGDTYSVYKTVEWRLTPKHIKIYRVNSDGTLQRYKTIYPEYLGGDGTSYNYKFETPITTGFPPGKYYAVHTYTYEYAGGYFQTEADRSYRFTID